jgi:hypothetical protein
MYWQMLWPDRAGREAGNATIRPLHAWSPNTKGGCRTSRQTKLARLVVSYIRSVPPTRRKESERGSLGEQECARCHWRADCYARAYENRPMEQAHKEIWPLRRERGVSPVLDRPKSALSAAACRASGIVSTRRCRRVCGRVGFPFLRSDASITSVVVVPLVTLRRASHKHEFLPQLCGRSGCWSRSVAPRATWLCVPPRRGR